MFLLVVLLSIDFIFIKRAALFADPDNSNDRGGLQVGDVHTFTVLD